MEFMGATLPYHAAWLMVIAVLVVIALRYFFTKTLVGLAMSAASADPDGATTTGINVGRMRSYTFLLGGSIGALAGILVTPLIGMNYHMGIALTLKGFAAAILGGLMNPLGAVVGGVVMGLLESLAVVGVYWLGLSKPHWGIHGTPEPAHVGRSESNGCIHLTNWDVLRVAQVVKVGFVVEVHA